MAQQTFEEIVAAVKQAESRGKRYAADGKTLTTSPKGALGEMQVMPKTITDPGFGVTPAKSSSPDEIARVGRDYLQAMLSKYGDTEKALVAYNWGPGATDKWLASGAKPEALPAETRTYVQRVKGLLGKDVPRETMAKKEREPLPESLPPMAQAEPKATTVAMASGKSLPDIKSMPASYQAAFALAALADAKDDEKEYDENKETESEKLMREYKPVNHLASLDLSVTPIMMKDGGDVDAEEKRPDDIKYFSNVNRMKDRGVTTDSVMLGARTKAGEGSVIAGLNMANMSKDEKMQTARALMLAYTQQDPEGLGFNANVVKPQGAPAMANLIGSMPLGEGRVSAGVHGNQAYSLGYERPVEGGQFNANLNVPRGTMGSPQLNLQFNKRFANGGDVDAEDLTKPSFGNPNIRKQGEAARRLAAMRDVNTLPDPKTYAAVAGALGTRPDQMGFSVLHPKYQEIRDVANPAFAAGTALQMAPAVQALGGGKAAKMLSNMAGQELNAALMGERPGTLLDMFTAPAQPKFMFVRARPEAAARHADLQAQGLSPEQIRAQNLTLVDNRGNLIEEISDAPAVLQQKTASVPRNFYEMLKHPELESIYPTYDMPQVMMETTKRKGAPLAMGNFDVQNNMISGRIRDLPEDDARSMVRGTVLHEGQHAIQSAEGFTEGANPGAFIAYVKARQGKYNPDPTVNENVIREMERAYPNLASVADNFTTRLQADKYMKYVVSDPDRYVGETLYRHMPGEVQAELVRVRSNLSPEQLKATPLEVSMQQLGVDPKNILEMNKMGSRPDRYVGDIDYDGYAHGGIVHRADGSPEEGERLTPQQIERIAAQEAAAREQASTAAFITSKSGIGRKAGNISNALNTGTAYPAMAQGALDVPYDLAGLPVDLTTMAMRPFGYSNPKPFLGSDYLKEQATEAGIRRPTPTDPTLKGFHTFGELGAGLLAPGKIIEGAQALKGAAKDALAGFKAGYKSEKPSVTDLMTGQRFETPELTPQQLQEFENWRSMSQAQLRAQNLAQRDEAVTRLPQDAQQQLRLFEENAIPRPVEQPLNNPPGWNIVDTGTEVAPALEAAAPVAAEARTMAQLPVVTPVAAPAPMQISAEFPFVGRLDEFAASMQGPAQKEQLINQVKGKFREQDVARLEEALAGLGPKDKVTPAMLQEALANTYSPSRLRSIDELASQGKPMYSNMDNVFAPDKPISGSMNLYIKQTPEAEALAKDAAELKLALNNVFQGRGDSSMFDTIDNILTNSPITGQLKNIGELKQQLSAYRPLYEKFNKIQQEANDAKHMLTYPVISGEKVFGKPLNDVVNERVKTAIQEGISAGRIPPIPHVDVPNQQLTTQQRMEKFAVENSMYAVTKQLRLEEEAKLFTEIMQKGSDKLVQLGVDPIDVTAIINKLPVKPSEDIYAANRGLNADIQFNEQVSSKIQAVRDSVKAAQEKVQDKMRDRYDRAIEDVNPLIGYRGQHAGVAGEVHPVGFARYTEHTVDMNGKQLNGRHVHELQSDLAQDVRQLGSKSGSLEKDQAELATLKSKLAEVDELDPTQQIEKAKLDKRISTVEKRISLTSPGKYQLEQPFAGFETSPAVEMQLLIKNAIQSTMRSGQDFVTFPGKESSQAKLYEKVLPNLKQAVKDLGGEKAGFDIKPITLPNPSGDSPTVWGVVWSPETAAKIMQKGVPFNKGGMVERKTDDNRRYL